MILAGGHRSSKLKLALEIGATDAFNTHDGSVSEWLLQNVGEADVCFECVGRANCLNDAAKIGSPRWNGRGRRDI